MDLYDKNLKDLKKIYTFIRFEKILWIFKNIFKITRISKRMIKNDEVWIKTSKTNIIF